ncbi:MAG: hypothetical protein J6V48_09910 [Clostridia bacterium]|nr:hypothetical protein [Clostridia bacterium]
MSCRQPQSAVDFGVGVAVKRSECGYVGDLSDKIRGGVSGGVEYQGG